MTDGDPHRIWLEPTWQQRNSKAALAGMSGSMICVRLMSTSKRSMRHFTTSNPGAISTRSFSGASSNNETAFLAGASWHPDFRRSLRRVFLPMSVGWIREPSSNFPDFTRNSPFLIYPCAGPGSLYATCG